MILDNLNEADIEILRVLKNSGSHCLTPDSVKGSGDNLISTDNVTKKLQFLKDQDLVVHVTNPPCYRIHANGENLFWGKGETWLKILNLLYVSKLELERLKYIIGKAESEFNSEFTMLRTKNLLTRFDIKETGKEKKLWGLTPDGRTFVQDQFGNTSENIHKDRDEVRNEIIKTEEKLQDFISSILTRKYSANWENDPNIGWSKKKKEELENRMNEKKKNIQKY